MVRRLDGRGRLSGGRNVALLLGLGVSGICPTLAAPVANADDCDDTNANIHPDQWISCGEGVDQNCDGERPLERLGMSAS